MTRISKETLDKCDTIEQLLDLATTTKNGEKLVYSDIGCPDNNYADFKSRLSSFKKIIKKDLPDFTIEEILKFDEYYRDLTALYNWYGFNYLFIALEFELKKSREKE